MTMIITTVSKPRKLFQCDKHVHNQPSRLPGLWPESDFEFVKIGPFDPETLILEVSGLSDQKFNLNSQLIC